LFNPLGAGLRWGVTLPQVKKDDVVAVLGPGLRGLCAVMAARRAGARFILLTGAGGQDAQRLGLGHDLGADVAIDVTVDDPRKALKAATGGLADVVVDVTAAAPAAFTQAIDLCRPGGTLVVAGTRGTHTIDGFNPDRIVLKELRVLGARGVDGVAYADALAMLADDARFGLISRQTVGLDVDGISALLDRMARGPDRPLHAVIVP
jgi:alcohol dehydrogenase